MSQLSGDKKERSQQPFFFASRRSTDAYGAKEDPKLVRESRRDKLNTMISIGGDDLDVHKMSRMLYGNPVPTQRNLIGVKSLTQAVELPSKLPNITADKLAAINVPSVLKNISESGPVRAKKLIATLPSNIQNKPFEPSLRRGTLKAPRDFMNEEHVQ